MKNILSIDLESWVHFYEDALKAKGSELASLDKRLLDNNYIPKATMNILHLLEKYGQKATFFALGELYEWYPEVIEEIEKRGHEIGYHTHTHAVLTGSEILEKELERSSNFIKRFKPIGFRAPQIFITRDSMACLNKWGFKYSSSTYGESRISRIEGIDEIPVSSMSFRGKSKSNNELPKHLTMKMLFREIPFGSGLFIGLLGSKTCHLINYLNKRNVPAVLFIHPWQLYRPKQIKGFSFKLKVLCHNPFCTPYTVNVLNAVEKLLKRHKFLSFREYYYR